MREEDKRKRDEVQKKKELEDENRKKRAAEAFSKFFVPKKKIDASVAVDDASKDTVECGPSSAVVKSNFIPFQIRERMKVAPCVRLQIDKDQLKTLDESLKTVKPLNELYLSELKNGLHKPSFSSSTWPLEEKDDDDDVSILGELMLNLTPRRFLNDSIVLDELDGAGEDIQMSDSDKKMKQRAKYLMFIENRRPAYHGTWCKKTTKISARRPFAQDPVKYFFIYTFWSFYNLLFYFTRNFSIMKLIPMMNGKKKKNLVSLSTVVTARRRKKLMRKNMKLIMTSLFHTVI